METGYVSAVLRAGQTDSSQCLHHAWVSLSNCFLPPLACPSWLLALSVLYSGFIHSLVLIQEGMGVERMFDG